MKQLIITEKPSVAQDIAKIYSSAKKCEGFIDCGEVTITWAFGHLIEIAENNAPEKWSLQSLPIIPSPFVYGICEGKSKQFNIIKGLLKTTQELIIATDSGREGELIARLILHHAKWSNWSHTKRFWSSQALSKEVVQSEMKKLKLASEYDSLFYSALARQQSDWICGINLTQLVTIKTNAGLYSVGRVQTPTLALLVNRGKERESFKKEEYYTIKAIFNHQDDFYTGNLKWNVQEEIIQEEDVDVVDNPKKVLDAPTATMIFNEVKQEGKGIITTITQENKSLPPPLLHSLTSLQREANNLYGITASETLSIAQELYEKHKIISYPRTDAQHLGESSLDLVTAMLTKLNQQKLVASVGSVGKRVFDDKKLTDHHAIIPFGPVPEGLGNKELQIYTLVYRKFVGAFQPNYEFEKTTLITQVGKHEFVSTGNVVKNVGWKELYKAEEEKEEDRLPLIQKHATVGLHDLKKEQKFTQPPPFFKESSLLKKMEVLGIGTPATRAAIIEILIKRNYAIREKKNLIATPKGTSLITILKNSPLVSADMTSEWETKLEEIYKLNKGKIGYETFLGNIQSFVKHQIDTLKIESQTPSISPEYKCSCGQLIQDSLKAFKCQCGNLIWKEIAGKKIDVKEATALLNGEKVLLKGLKSKAGKLFNTTAIYNVKEKKVEFQF